MSILLLTRPPSSGSAPDATLARRARAQAAMMDGVRRSGGRCGCAAGPQEYCRARDVPLAACPPSATS